MVKASLKNRFQKFYNAHKKEVLVLLGILILGAFLRLFRIADYMTFLGDEGRDAIIVRRFLVHGDIFLIGPGTSIGNMYLGPFYYYMMAPALLLAGFSPVGPSMQIALLGVVTIWLVWWIAREWFGATAGLIAAFLFAISPTVIIYSRSSWNPNIMPFFALLSIYSLWRAIKYQNFKWLLVLGFSFAASLQSHYLGLLLAPTLGIMWLAGLYLVNSRRKFVLWSIVSGILFLAMMSPLLIFDSRHGWINANAIKIFFTERQTTVSARPWNAIPEFWPELQKITTRLAAGRNEALGMWTALFMILGSLTVYKNRKKLDINFLAGFTITLTWLMFALVGLALYKQEVYDHYYGFFFAAPFMIIGAVSAVLIKKAKIRGTWLVFTGLIFLAFFSFLDSPVRYPPNRQLARSVAVAEKIQEAAGGKPFNLAVIAERNYEDAYQYFLEWWGTGVTDIDPQRSEETITDQLYVVCELPDEKCDPTHNPKAEVANFGWTKIESQWNISGVILYKLVHSQ